ncbi:MAG: hypothetical protein Greene041619_371 [Candidatus Peregrinibacteria bacterium Greene0416_19]|nr:MAG: hypothetical protein Greene041619_371 [Candidatus Peregrinibacteria bacterium Greene0416_19]
MAIIISAVTRMAISISAVKLLLIIIRNRVTAEIRGSVVLSAITLALRRSCR